MQIIKLDGYNATTDNGKKLELGTFDSYGEEQLQIVKAQNWENLSVIATFNPPNKKPVQVVVDSVTGVIKVPKEATADLYGIGTIVFVGLSDGVQRISADVEYIVRKHSNANGTEPAEPTPNVVEQILTEAQNANVNSAEAKKIATDAKDIAQSVRTDADDGKFNGKDGAKGDKGETGTTPRLKIGEDNLWNVSYDNGATWVSLGVKATGATGEDGSDGLTPYIGENGNWWLGDTDTGVSAKGPKGDPGPDDLVIVTYENGKLSKTYDELLADINANKIVAIKNVGSQKFPYYLYDYLDNTYGLFFSASPRLQASPYQRIFLPFIGVKSDNTITANLGITSGTVPSGGKTGQVLAKKSDKSYVVQWVDMPDVSQLEEDVTKLKEDATALKKRQNVLVGSETGNPVSCNDAYSAPLCGLTVYGKSTQDGTPTPENPVEIKSVVNPTVKVCGKNLLEDGSLKSDNNGKIEYISAGKIKVTASTSVWYSAITNTLKLTPNTNYVLSAKCDSSNGRITCNSVNGSGADIKCAFSTDSDGLATIAIRCRYESAESKFVYSDLQLEKGSTATAYKPYTEQTVTLPYTLNAIPVTSGGNYTDPQGQQFVCDEVDFERGILIRRIYSEIYTGAERWMQNNSSIFLALSEAARDALKNTAISNIAVPCGSYPELSDSKPVGLRPTASGLSIDFFFVNNAQPTLDDWKTALSKTNAHVQYVLKKPIESKLTDAELAAYKALTTYAPDTVVQASDGAGIKLDYQRDVNIVVKNLEDAIASMTTTT